MAAEASANELIASLTPEQRARLLGDLVRVCAEDGTIAKPQVVADENGRPFAYVVNFFPKTVAPGPTLTVDEHAELQRRIDRRHEAMTQDEFIAEVRRLRKSSSGTT
jgi:hypothetical protein